MSVNVPQLIVHVEEAPQALLSRGHRPVARQDILVELKVRRGLGEVQQTRSASLKNHNSSLQPLPSH